jgi:hypothetical protein
MFHSIAGRYGQFLLDHRSLLVIFTQLGLIAAANVTGFALRFEGNIPPDHLQLFLWGLPIVLAIYGMGLVAFGIQRGLWRYVGLHDLGRILWASVISSAVLYGVVHGLLGWVAYPRSVIILTGVLSGLFLAGIRLNRHSHRDFFAPARNCVLRFPQVPYRLKIPKRGERSGRATDADRASSFAQMHVAVPDALSKGC